MQLPKQICLGNTINKIVSKRRLFTVIWLILRCYDWAAFMAIVRQHSGGLKRGSRLDSGG